MIKNKKKRNLGKAFPDEVVRINKGSSHFWGNAHSNTAWQESLLPNFRLISSGEQFPTWRLTLIIILAIIFFGALFIRLFHLQVVEGAYNQYLADSNRVQIKIVHAPRGVIYDRNGQILAQNNPGFRLKDRLVSRDEALKLETSHESGLNELEIDSVRFYPQGEITSHLLGYVAEINPEELKNSKSYRLGDRIGRSGIEASYEDVLRGVDGAEIIETDATGVSKRVIRRIEPTPGQNVYLSVDIDLQRVLFQALKKGIGKSGSCCGAAIAADPKTGEILGLVSIPSFDSNAFNDPTRIDEVKNYFILSSAPLLNRAIAGTYPPGSTFKITTSLSALQSGKITEKTQFEDTGVIYLGSFSFSNWYYTEYGKTEGTVDLVKALKRSNDTYFYHVGSVIGEEQLSKTAQQVGFGKKVGIDIPGEVTGLVPSDSWKKNSFGEGWYPGDTLHMAIGQGFMLVTPLQIMQQTALIASNGYLTTPHLGTKVTSPQGALIKNFRFLSPAKHFKDSELALVKKGLSQVPKVGGTAWPFFNFSIPTAGKTGTAEFGDPKSRTHAWYTSFAPEDNPQIVLTVLVEAAGEGSNVAAPISKEVYTWYFNQDKLNLKSLDAGPVASAAAKQLGE